MNPDPKYVMKGKFLLLMPRSWYAVPPKPGIWTNPFWSMMEIPPTEDVVRVVALDCSNCLTWQVNIGILVRKKQMICHRISLIVAYCRLCLFIAYPRAARVSRRAACHRRDVERGKPSKWLLFVGRWGARDVQEQRGGPSLLFQRFPFDLALTAATLFDCSFHWQVSGLCLRMWRMASSNNRLLQLWVLRCPSFAAFDVDRLSW